MHVTKREGLRCVALTEEEFDKVMDGFNCLMQEYILSSKPAEAAIEKADEILTGALEILAVDDGES